MNSKHRIVFSLRALAAACATVLALAAAPAPAAPYLPRAGAEVLESLPRRTDPVQQELQGMRRQLAAAPQDVQLATALAQRYIGIGRSEADPRYFGYAQAALAPWWNQAAPPPAVRLLRATLLQGTHRFPAAMADLDAVTAADPANAQAWLTRATVQTVLGQYGPATASCARLSALAGELASITCLTNVSGLTGRLLKSDMLLATTLALAQQNWGVQKEPADLRILHEAAQQAGDRAAAAAALAWLAQTGLEDAAIQPLAALAQRGQP
jgi:hypothetical protein